MPDLLRRPEKQISVFLSYPTPCAMRQRQFIAQMFAHLERCDFVPRTLGVTDFDGNPPLDAVRQLIAQSSGLVAVAFRRTYLADATAYHDTDVAGLSPYHLKDAWFTSPWTHIEVAMAYQLDLPIMVLCEAGVVRDGVLEESAAGTYMPVFDVHNPIDDYFAHPRWNESATRWEAAVRSAAKRSTASGR